MCPGNTRGAKKFMKADILGVKIDRVSMDETLEIAEKWICSPGKHYIVTPNPEFILAAQKDLEFKRILNNADLAIPDSSSLGFSYWLLQKNILIRALLWPLFLLPLKQSIHFDRVAGIDLMEALCKLAAEKGFTVSLLGGEREVAEKAAECLQKKYPKLKVVYAESGGYIDDSGVAARLVAKNRSTSKSRSFNNSLVSLEARQPTSNCMVDSPHFLTNSNFATPESVTIPPTDLLFVAFGHIKQEKWMVNNLERAPAHVMMGVGGAFDYLSGNVPRAPGWMRNLGFEWLYRLIVQPWRIKRQLSLLQYPWLLIKA